MTKKKSVNVTGVSEVPVVVKDDGSVIVLDSNTSKTVNNSQFQINAPVVDWNSAQEPGTSVNEEEYEAKKAAKKQRRLYIIGAIIIIPLLVALVSSLF